MITYAVTVDTFHSLSLSPQFANELAFLANSTHTSPISSPLINTRAMSFLGSVTQQTLFGLFQASPSNIQAVSITLASNAYIQYEWSYTTMLATFNSAGSTLCQVSSVCVDFIDPK